MISESSEGYFRPFVLVCDWILWDFGMREEGAFSARPMSLSSYLSFGGFCFFLSDFFLFSFALFFFLFLLLFFFFLFAHGIRQTFWSFSFYLLMALDRLFGLFDSWQFSKSMKSRRTLYHPFECGGILFDGPRTWSRSLVLSAA